MQFVPGIVYFTCSRLNLIVDIGHKRNFLSVLDTITSTSWA